MKKHWDDSQGKDISAFQAKTGSQDTSATLHIQKCCFARLIQKHVSRFPGYAINECQTTVKQTEMKADVNVKMSRITCFIILYT